jgi:hypothetical protein
VLTSGWSFVKRFLVTVATVLVGIGIVAGIGVFSWINEREPETIVAQVDGTLQTPQGELPHARLDLSIYPNPSDKLAGPRTTSAFQANLLSEQPFFWPSTSIQVPANSAVTITFTQYGGPMGQIYNDYFAEVHGTIDGTMKWNGKSVSKLKATEVTHTFTVHQYTESNQPTFFLNVPLPINGAKAKMDKAGYAVEPQKVEVTFITGDAGTYVWNCQFPCGDMYQEFGGAMQTRGWMGGTFEVV